MCASLEASGFGQVVEISRLRSTLHGGQIHLVRVYDSGSGDILSEFSIGIASGYVLWLQPQISGEHGETVFH